MSERKTKQQKKALLAKAPERGVKRSLRRDERGLSTVEYIIILVLIAVAGIGLWTTFGETVGNKITSATGDVEGMGSGGSGGSSGSGG